MFLHTRYDQLNRIVAMRAYQGLNQATNTWTPVAIDDYQETISYDPNGNIKTYVRNGAPSIAGKATAMDDLFYHYNAGTNQLNHVTDNVSAGNYTEDIDGQSSGNYDYDAIGNLTKDVSEGITDINWTVYGKIANITKNGNVISYTYDAAGQRVTKTIGDKTTLYVRDASGNVMSVYEIPAVNTIEQKELHLYGSSRLGMALAESKPADNGTPLVGGSTAFLKTYVRAEKVFELSNHLDNVLVAISDKKIQIQKANPYETQIDYYIADVVTATDYAPFGMQLFGREYSIGSKYRYGFNGKEKEKSVGNDVYDFGARIYDGRLGRWLSTDPLQKKYPSLSPYLFSVNNPIVLNDPDGRDAIVTITRNKDGGGIIKVQTVVYITGSTEEWRATRYNVEAKGVYKNQEVDVEGKKWEIQYDVKYEYRKNFDVNKMTLGHNVLEIDPNTELSGRARSHVNWRNNTGKISTEDRKSYKVIGHETGHLIGFVDQYTEVKSDHPGFINYLKGKYNSKEDNAPGGKIYQMLKIAYDSYLTETLSNEGYENNQMNNNNGQFSDVQNRSLVNKVLSLSKDKDGTFILQGMFDERGKPSEKDLKKAYDTLDKKISDALEKKESSSENKKP